MAKRSVPKAPEETEVQEEMIPEETGLTPEEEEAIAEEEEAKRQARLAPYRAVATQQKEQDNLLAELLYEITLVELGIEI